MSGINLVFKQPACIPDFRDTSLYKGAFFFFIPPFFSLGLEEDESAGVHAFVWSDNEGEAQRQGNLAASVLPVTDFFFFFIQRLLKDKHFFVKLLVVHFLQEPCN